MKIHINKNLRIILLITSIILMCAASFYLYKEVKYPSFKEEKITLFSYNNMTNVNYRVFLKPNILYDVESIGEGNIYIAEFVDYIDTSFNYEFRGERYTDVKGDYEIIAKVEGVIGEDEDFKTIWKKDFVLLPKASFQANDKTISVKEDFKLKLQEYNEFAQQVIKTSKIGSKVKMTVLMNVRLKANTDKGIVEEKISPTMIIPLNANYFEIGGNLSQEKPGSIEETKQVQLPINKNKVIVYGIILGISLILLIFIIFFTKAKLMMDPFEKKIRKIFKKHGDRLVALNNEIAVTCENYSEVKSIEDLVRIADEIEKPITYKHSIDYKEISKFYVYDESQMYVFDLTTVLIDKNIDKEKKDSSEDDVNKLKKTISELKASKPKIKESETETTE